MSTAVTATPTIPAVLVPFLAAALAVAVVLVASLSRGRQRVPTMDLVRDHTQAIIAEINRERRPGALRRARTVVAERCARAGVSWLRPRVYVLLTLLAALGGLALGNALTGVPIWALIGAVWGAYLPWALLGVMAVRLRRQDDADVLEFIELLEFAVMTGGGPLESFADATNQLHHGRLRTHVRAVVTGGGSGRDFVDLLGALDAAYAHPWLHLAVRVLVVGQRQKISVAQSLAYTAAYVRDSYDGQQAARADYAQILATNALVFAMPFVLTLAQAYLAPGPIADFYASPLGIATALGLTAVCTCGYRYVARRERKLVDEARGGK
jgi:Flp pilus assembly protein TadB